MAYVYQHRGGIDSHIIIIYLTPDTTQSVPANWGPVLKQYEADNGTILDMG